MAMSNSYVELPEGNFPLLSYWPVDPWIILNLRRDTIKISTNQGNWKPINGKLKGCLSLHIEARICLVQLLNASALHGIEKSSKSWANHGLKSFQLDMQLIPRHFFVCKMADGTRTDIMTSFMANPQTCGCPRGHLGQIRTLLGFRTSLLIRVGSPGFYQVFIRWMKTSWLHWEPHESKHPS